jgi:GDP-L-fucose synthase
MNKDAKIYIAGHNGMVGSVICETLTAKAPLIGFEQGTGSEKPTSRQRFYGCRKPEVIIDAAAKWRILANNDFPYQFIGKHANQNNRYRH